MALDGPIWPDEAFGEVLPVEHNEYGAAGAVFATDGSSMRAVASHLAAAARLRTKQF
jgi:hypothetical protein